MTDQFSLIQVKKALMAFPEVEGKLVQGNAEIKYNPEKTESKDIVNAIRKLGFDVIEENSLDREKKIKEKEINDLKNLFFISLILTIPLVILAFPEFFYIDFAFRKFILFLLATPIQFFVGYRFYKSAFTALKVLNANMDTLIVLGTSASYFYSVLGVFLPNIFGGDLYFDIGAVIITFIMLGKWLEAKAKGRAGDAIKKLMGLQPKTARILKKR